MPPQLQLSLLNVPPAVDAIAALPRPQHVILNHIYLQVGFCVCAGGLESVLARSAARSRRARAAPLPSFPAAALLPTLLLSVPPCPAPRSA